MTMHELRRFIERIPADFVGRVMEIQFVQGVFLDVNPIWYRAYTFEMAGLDGEFDPYFRLPYEAFEFIEPSQIALENIDFSWFSPPWVQAASDRLFKKEIDREVLPFLAKVVVSPKMERENRQTLLRIIQTERFPALIETRPEGRLIAAPGDACATGVSGGTIGGFLEDTVSGDRFAATCGHVVSKGTTVRANGKPLGICKFSSAPLAMGAGTTCSLSIADSLDFALIEVGSRAVVNTASGLAKSICPKQLVTLRGATSGLQKYEVGAISMVYEPGLSNVCFKNLFEVRPILSGMINAKISAAFATVPTTGDSGAWIHTSSSEWCGVLVAADTIMGYALEADLVNLDANFGTHLSLL